MSVVPSLEDSYRFCRELTKREAKNFYYGFFFLAPARRRAIYAAYSFARESDDIIDSDLPSEQKEAHLKAYRERLDNCLAGKPEGEIFIALGDVVQKFGVPQQYFYQLLDGVEMDLRLRRYANFEELRRYCYLVAAVVGLISLEIFGHRGGETARPYATDLGIALQLTNILRDIQEDAQRDRIYLPLDELAQFSYSPESLMAGEVGDGFRRLMGFQVSRAREYYASGRKLLPLLPWRSRLCVRVMTGIYSRLLDAIAKRPEAVFQERISLSAGQKLALAGRAALRSLVPL